ncbi:MAG: tellurite resistance/C4-dicarboxylate transporter family protein [Thermodesulfobacteriota bacterium]
MAIHTDRLNWLKNLYPGYFVLTMATGIIGIGFNLLELKFLSHLFYILTVVSWSVIAVLFIARILLFPKAIWADLMNPVLTFNFFTFVAGTCVLGLMLDLEGYKLLPLICWVGAYGAWILLLYASFSVLTLLHGERKVNVVDGGWLVCIVGTEALVLLGLRVVPSVGMFSELLMLNVFMLWGVGIILYAIFVALFCYRIFFIEMKATDYTPQMWVIMGAAAITANASSSLDMATPVLVVLTEVHAFVDSVALLSWAWATWWIPLLVIISFWKHAVKKVPLGYEPRQWSVVFPIGMYTVAGYQLSLASQFDPLHQISHVMIWIAVTLWVLLAIGLLSCIARGLFITTNHPGQSMKNQKEAVTS